MTIRRAAVLGLISGVALAAVAAATAQSAGQPTGQPAAPAESNQSNPGKALEQPSVEQFMAAVEAQSKPVAAHDALAAFDGKWEASANLYLGGPGPMNSTGTSTNHWILGKRFMQVETAVGDAKTVRSEAVTIYGYDTRIQKYTVIGLDTFGTYGIYAQGDYDAASKTLTLLGTNDEAGRQMDFRWVVKFESADRIVQTVYLNLLEEDASAPAPAGDKADAAPKAAKEPEWFKMSEVVYTRKK